MAEEAEPKTLADPAGDVAKIARPTFESEDKPCKEPIKSLEFTSGTSVAEKLLIRKLGTPILTIGARKPLGVAINQRGEVVVTEAGGGPCVSVFSQSGEKLRSFGTQGSGEGQFNNFRGVAIDSEGNILVADTWNHRIQKFTSEGRFLTTVGALGKGPLQFTYPTGVTVCPSNNKVYVVDEFNNRVQVLNPDLSFSYSFGKSGGFGGQFYYPRSIAFDSTGKVYVTDTNNHRIQVFTAEGEFLRMFGTHGQEEGELRQPRGLAIDTSTDMVYVGEGENHRVSVFTSEGQFVTSLGTEKEGPEFKYPYME